VITLCPECDSNNVSGVIIDEDHNPQDNPHIPIMHFICKSCGTEWVE